MSTSPASSLLSSASHDPGLEAGFAGTTRDLERFYSVEGFNAVLTADPGEQTLDIGPGGIEGTLPRDLAGGRYLLNGPARVRLDGWLMHPFDGHGFLREFRFRADGGVGFRSRFVRTPAFVKEDAAGRVLYRGLGTLVAPPTLRGGGFLRNMRAPGGKNVANTTVYPWNGQLLCGWEGGPPFRVDPETLDTVGPETFAGVLEDKAFLAHTRVDRATNRLVGVSPTLGANTKLTFYELDTAGALVSTTAYTWPGAMFIHDFAMTEHYYVLTSNPLKIDVGAFLRAKLGMATLLDCIAADRTREGQVILVPRDRAGGLEALSIPLGQPVFAVHHANAYEQDGKVVLDSCAFQEIAFGHEFGFQGPKSALDPTPGEAEPGQRVYRIVIDPEQRSAVLRQVTDIAMDFPRVHPDRDGKACGIVYGAGRSDARFRDPFDCLVRLEPGDPSIPEQRWIPGRERFVGEPVFAPRQDARDEGDGWVLVVVYDAAAGRAELCVLEARAIEQGPVAVIPLPGQMPYGFHGCFYRPV